MPDINTIRELTGQFNVLYAEDEPALRESVAKALGRLFKEVHVAKDGFEALDIYKSTPIDILITDLSMPILGGIGLIDKIHELTENPPAIIVFSAHSDATVLIKLINKGVDRFLAKPVDLKRMREMFYKLCLQLSNAKMVQEYQVQLQNMLLEMEYKNRALEQKLNQLASATNRIRPAEQQSAPTPGEGYYGHLDPEHKEELSELSSDLDYMIFTLFSKNDLDEATIRDLSALLHKYGAILNRYVEFVEVGIAVESLSRSIAHHPQMVLEHQEQSGVYLESFQMTLENFRHNTWNRRAFDPTFYNASLLSDINLLIDFLSGNETQGEIEFF
ncbi:MAG: response regulator [Campylobacterales bacterium]|nr:response regulator [Campylobacterales bacterium]